MLKRMRSFLVVVMLLITATMSAQVTTASMSGKVTAQDEPIIGATIVAIHEPSGTRYGTVTNVSGQFNLQGMRTGGPYKVEITYVGYQSAIYTGIQLSLGENYVLNVSLKESSELLDEVVVTASKNSNMKSDRAGAITNIGEEQMAMLPAINRSMNDVMRLTPQGANTGNGFAVGGGNYRQSSVTVDGAAFSNAFGIGSNLPGGGSPISLDALEQIAVSVTPFDVRQSGFIGGAINAVTKSGTNDFYGTAYTYLTNENLKGNKVGDLDLIREKSQNYLYGASFGGAIIKNKLFFFVNGEYEDNVTAGPKAKARANDGDDWGSKTANVNRPTVSDMNEIRDYFINKYNYDPGQYQGYSIKTPAYKIMARLDWNINDNNKLNFRFTRAHSKDNSGPTSSTSPLYATDIYPGGADASKGSGTVNNNTAMYFENSRYYKEYNFTSYASEWNSKWLNGSLNNVTRMTYSFQDEPRSFDGAADFPTVDILKDGAVYARIGPDLFTPGNLAQAKTFVLTDEISYTAGIHNLLAGFQFEYNKATNGFMQAGNGYYVFDSWDSFKNNKYPSAFAITHSNAADYSQFKAEMKTLQYSLYIQDQMNISDNFKLMAGIRFELPKYPSLKDNYNEDFARCDFGGVQYSTDQVPSAKISVSPRVGFNWDITGERKFVLRGGTGIYVGRLPFVWLVSAVGNSNVGQYQYYYSDITKASLKPYFQPTVSGVLNELYPNGRTADVKAPKDPTIIDKDLKMPSTWKTSLAFDAKLPGDIDFSLEGIFNKDINPAVISNKAFKPSDGTTTFSPNDTRNSYGRYTDPSWTNSSQNVYFIENGGHKAYYYSITAQLAKSFDFGLYLSAAYTHSKAKSYSDGIGDQVTSAYKTNTYSVNGINEHETGYGTYVSPHRVVASAGYRVEYAKNFASSLSLVYEGMNMGYAGGYGYARYSYTFAGNIVGDGGANNLLYIPASREELNNWNFAEKTKNSVTGAYDDYKLDGQIYTADQQKDDFWAYINQDSYLKNHKGEYVKRGGVTMPWHHQLDLKFMQDFYMKVGGKRHTLQFGVDIKNVLNLLNSDWGLYKTVNNTNLLAYDKGNKDTGEGKGYTFQKSSGKKLTDTYTDYKDFRSTYSVMFSVRYIFH